MMELTNAEKQSPLWMKLTQGMAARIEDLHRQNEREIEHQHASIIRGQIKELRILIRLGNVKTQGSQPPLEGATVHEAFN